MGLPRSVWFPHLLVHFLTISGRARRIEIGLDSVLLGSVTAEAISPEVVGVRTEVRLHVWRREITNAVRVRLGLPKDPGGRDEGKDSGDRTVARRRHLASLLPTLDVWCGKLSSRGYLGECASHTDMWWKRQILIFWLLGIFPGIYHAPHFCVLKSSPLPKLIWILDLHKLPKSNQLFRVLRVAEKTSRLFTPANGSHRIHLTARTCVILSQNMCGSVRQRENDLPKHTYMYLHEAVQQGMFPRMRTIVDGSVKSRSACYRCFFVLATGGGSGTFRRLPEQLLFVNNGLFSPGRTVDRLTDGETIPCHPHKIRYPLIHDTSCRTSP